MRGVGRAGWAGARLAAEFELRYAEWRRVAAQGAGRSSADEAFVDNAAFRALVELGASAVPLVIDKLRTDPGAHFLIHALPAMTGQRLEAAAAGQAVGNQEVARLWIEWWDGSRGAETGTASRPGPESNGTERSSGSA